MAEHGAEHDDVRDDVAYEPGDEVAADEVETDEVPADVLDAAPEVVAEPELAEIGSVSTVDEDYGPGEWAGSEGPDVADLSEIWDDEAGDVIRTVAGPQDGAAENGAAEPEVVVPDPVNRGLLLQVPRLRSQLAAPARVAWRRRAQRARPVLFHDDGPGCSNGVVAGSGCRPRPLSGAGAPRGGRERRPATTLGAVLDANFPSPAAFP